MNNFFHFLGISSVKITTSKLYQLNYGYVSAIVQNPNGDLCTIDIPKDKLGLLYEYARCTIFTNPSKVLT